MNSQRFRFGAFEADLAAGELTRDGVPVPLQDLPFRLLAALLERPGEVISRAELTDRLWGSETFVDAAAGLNTAVAKLREALGDNPEAPAFIETIPKRGYRFIGEMTTAGPQAGSDDPVIRPSTPGVLERLVWLAAAAAASAIVAVAAYQFRAASPQVRVAVVLFDNETGQPDFDRLAQGLTDATVFALAADPRLAVVGNASVLRTARPFRDIALVRDTLDADYIVIGQVQMPDAQLLVRGHLIRAKDEAHVWVGASRLTPAGEAALEAAVSQGIAAATAAKAFQGR